jgi:excisionase family DNA binding protein
MRMADAMTYSVKQAAEATGKTKPTILRAIQRGRLAATQDSNRRWWIEEDELQRAFRVTARTGTRNGAAEGISETTELLRCILAELRRLNAKLIGQPTPMSITPLAASAGAVAASNGQSTTLGTESVPAAEETAQSERLERRSLGDDARTGTVAPTDRAGELEGADVRQVENTIVPPTLKAARELFDRGGTALKEKRYADAVEQFRKAAALVPDGYPAALADCLDGLADAFYRHGCERGDNALLKQSVETSQAALRYHPRHQVPFDWARTQNSLGAALLTLGERQNNAVLLTEAVAAFRGALEERTRDRPARDWATTQHHLGIALARLGLLQNDAAHLAEAVVAFRAALDASPRDQVPLDWAAIQYDLAEAHLRLSERTADTTHLLDAVAAYRMALVERTRDRVPLDWATTFGNQGVALMLLAERNGDATAARFAVQQIESAFMVMQSHGKADLAAGYSRQLPRARIVLHRLIAR